MTMNTQRPAKLGKTKAGDPGYRERIQGEAKFWDERAERLWASGRIPLWFDHRRGEDVTFIPLGELKGAGIRANPVLYRAVFGGLIDYIIRAATGKKGNVLDLGCGAGWFSLELARCGMSVDGLDISPGQIEIAKRMSRESKDSADPRLHGDFGRTNYRVADLNAIRLEKEKYDVAVSLGTLHHIQRLDYLMNEVKKSLKPGGKFIFWEYVGYSGLARLFPALFKAAGIMAAAPRRWIRGQSTRPITSPFEGVSQSEILKTVRRDFSVETMESRFLFLPVLVSRLRIYRLSPMISLPLIRALDRVDRGLIGSRLFRGPFILGVARKT
jgi:SAM-dependent methyltransferase